MAKGSIIFRKETVTTNYTYSSDAIDKRDFGTFGSFIEARNKPSRDPYGEHRTKDRRRFGRCIVCVSEFKDEDKVHRVFSVFKNSKCLGNLFACDSCAEKHGNITTKA